MNRRNFLKILGVGAVAAATPKYVFDMGANLYKQKPELWLREYDAILSHQI